MWLNPYESMASCESNIPETLTDLKEQLPQETLIIPKDILNVIRGSVIPDAAAGNNRPLDFGGSKTEEKVRKTSPLLEETFFSPSRVYMFLFRGWF